MFLALHILAIELAFKIYVLIDTNNYSTCNFIWNFILFVFPISLGILISIIGEIQINKYINQGGKLSKITIYFLATVWWVINIPSGYFLYFFTIFGRVVQGFAPLLEPWME